MQEGRAQQKSVERDRQQSNREGERGWKGSSLGSGHWVSVDQPLSSSPTATGCAGWPGPDQQVHGLPRSQAVVGRIVPTIGMSKS